MKRRSSYNVPTTNIAAIPAFLQQLVLRPNTCDNGRYSIQTSSRIFSKACVQDNVVVFIGQWPPESSASTYATGVHWEMTRSTIETLLTPLTASVASTQRWKSIPGTR
jgi:hypothetical protein